MSKQKTKKIYMFFFQKPFFSCFSLIFFMRKLTKNKIIWVSILEITVNIYINVCIFVLSALNKILFPCVSNYGSKGRDAVKNSISNSVFTPFSTVKPSSYRYNTVCYLSCTVRYLSQPTRYLSQLFVTYHKVTKKKKLPVK